MNYNKIYFKLILVCSFIFLSLVFSSCNKKKKVELSEKPATHFNDTLLTLQENPKLVEFRNYVAALDSTDVNSIKQAVDKFKVLFAGQSQGLCDTSFVVFQNLLDTVESNLNKQLQNDTVDYAEVLSETPIPHSIKEYQTKLSSNGFKLVNSDGFIYIEAQNKFVLNNFSTLLSDTYNDYLKEIEVETAEGFAKDDKISISPQKLVDRIIWYETFIKTNPNFILINNCKNYRKAYFTYLLKGYGGTKVLLGKDSKDISTYFVTAYNYLTKKYPTAETTNLVTPYYDALKKKQSTKDFLKQYFVKGLIYDLD